MECQKEKSFMCYICPYSAFYNQFLDISWISFFCSHYLDVTLTILFLDADFGVSLAATSLDNYFIRDDDWFICITCHKKYKHRTSVWRHVKWECNKQPQFECHVCGKRVTQKATLKTHVENVHGLVYVNSRVRT
ncbi:hypothetical protein HUJ04_008544 [Dendroctonus ponderosae]|nr:hypothetical protein HUJ04_008544 [Dendroctonus ponderosae]